MELFKLFGRIAVENDEANEAIDETTQKAEQSQSKIKSSFEKIGSAFVKAFSNNSKVKETSQSLKQLTETVDKQESTLTQLKNKYRDLYLTHGKNSTEAKECAKEIDRLSSELKENKTKLTEAERAADKFDKTLDDVSDSSSGASNSMSDSFKKIGAAVATYFAVDKIIDFGKQVVDAAATVSAEASAFEQIMGSYSDTATEKMNQIADNTGMVATRLTPYMTSMTAKFKGLGYDIDEATNLASDGLNLAADAAAFWDMSLDDSMSHLNSFINGSYEGGEAIGLFANDTQMASYAVSQGIVKQTKDWASLDEATKQATRLEYAQNMMKASGAVGQAAKESDQYANVQANLTEKWRQFKAQIGEPLLQNVVNPAMEKLSSLVDWASVKFKELSTWVGENKTLLTVLGTVIGSVATGMIAYNAAQTAMTLGAKLHAAATVAEKLAVLGVNTAMWASPITWIVAGIAALIAIIVVCVKHWDEIKEAATKAWEKIKEVWGKVSEWFKTTVIDPIVNFFTDLWNSMKSIWDGIKNVISVAFLFIVNLVKSYFDLITLPFRFIWENCKEYVFAAWEWIKEKVSAALDKIKEVITTVWTAVKDFLTPILEAIKNAVNTAWNAIQTTIKTVMDKIKSVITTVWNAIKSVISTVSDTIKSVVTTAWNAIKSAIEKPLNAAKSIVSNIFNGIKTTISNVINSAKSIVQTGLNAIKGFFDKLKIKFPNIKLPHFSIKGKFSLDPPSVPKLAIDWYAKAMNAPMLLTKPTIFGMNPNGNLMGGGEAGNEVVSGASTLMNMIQSAVGAETSGLISIFSQLVSILSEYFPEIIDRMEKEIVLDDGTLVGKLAPKIDAELGNINRLKIRGN